MYLPALVLTVALVAPAADKPAFVGVQIKLAEGEKAVVVTATLADSPAQKAGLLAGDVLLQVDGLAPVDVRSAVATVRALKPNKKVIFRVRRDGKVKDIEVTPAEAE